MSPSAQYRRVHPRLLLMLCVLVCGWIEGPAAGQAPRVDPFALWISSRVEALEHEWDTHDTRLKLLPEYAVQSTTRAGFHSAFANSQLEPQWVQIDLGRVAAIDAIALVPVSIVQDNVQQNGYGFPLRFRVQVSVDPDFRLSSLVADQTTSDYPNPGKYPCQFTGLNVSGRYVRLTCTKLALAGRSPFFALSEFIVISGERNIAAWRPVTTSGSTEARSRWSKRYLVDEVSILPLPGGLSDSKTNGYLSHPSDTPETTKWIQLDLRQERRIDEIRIVPSRPLERADIPGWSVPESFRIEVANREDFADAVPYCDFSRITIRHLTNHPLVFPAEVRESLSRGDFDPAESNPDPFPSAPVEARYVRLKTTQLDSRIRPSFLALAEIQVLSHDENVARNAIVTASDTAGPEYGPNWSPQFLVDDYSSRKRLWPFVDWLAQIDRRRLFEERRDATAVALRRAVDEVWLIVIWCAGVGMIVSLAIVAVFIRRQYRRHRRQTDLLRTQIASDLHDDIGSNLGTIALLCQTFDNRDALPNDLHQSLQEIRTIALETGDAMRDILWLMRSNATRLNEFLGRMRTITNRMTQGFEVVFDAPDDVPGIEIDLAWRRNVFLSFKESLYNAVRHSRATHIVVQVRAQSDTFEIVVMDNGAGFSTPASRDGGLGLGNLNQRLAAVRGTAEVSSESGKGTIVTLRAPLRSAPQPQALPTSSRTTRRWTAVSLAQRMRRLLLPGIVSRKQRTSGETNAATPSVQSHSPTN